MAITDKPWNGAASKYSDTNAYCRACLVDLNTPGQDKTQDNCKLPIREENGDINVNALPAALGALNGARSDIKLPVTAKKKAAKALLRAYREAKLDVPDSLKNMAS